MDTIKFYEYMIKDNTIIKTEFEVEEMRKDFYLVESRWNRRFINKSDFEKIVSNRILSFNDDFDKYARMLLIYQEQKVEKSKRTYEQQLRTFNALKTLFP